jgi:hypothetical protein
MRIRWPFVLRSTHEAAIEAQLARHHIHVGDLHCKLNLAAKEREGLEVHIGDLAHTIDLLQDEMRRQARVYSDTDNARIDAGAEIVRLRARLDSYGHVPPLDWAAPLPYWLSSVVTADTHGVRGEVGGMAEDPTSDDPRRNMALPMGLATCSTGQPSPIE